MISGSSKIRLFVDTEIICGAEIVLGEAASHYLCNVMRLGQGENFAVFNGRQGEFECRLTAPHKKAAQALVLTQTKPFYSCPDLWLLFAPLKKEATDYLLQKATELGVSRIIPVMTERTNTTTVRTERYLSQVAEAAEQSRRLDVPQIGGLLALQQVVQNWDPERVLYLMDETGKGDGAAEAFAAANGKPAAILIGPEGGFSPEEIKQLYALPFVKGISLGPRILRAETAAAAALAVWQAVAGDWCRKETQE